MNLAQELPRGGLIEISGVAGGGRIEAVLRFLAENPGLQAAWVEEGDTLYPCAFPQHGVALERVLFVNAEPVPGLPGVMMDCAHQILRSGIFGVLVLIPRDSAHFGFIPTTTPSTGRSAVVWSAPREIELRRLQLAAEKADATVFIVREKPSVGCTWPLAAQLRVSRTRIEILKHKRHNPEVFYANRLSLPGSPAPHAANTALAR